MDARTKELKYRAEARKKELEAKLAEARADAAGEGRERAESLKAKIDELESSIKGGWDNLTDEAADRLNELLKKD